MDLGTLQTYRHSGKFGLHALLFVPLVGALVGWPLGMAYGYLVKWIPFVYLNALITVGYGLALGMATVFALKKCRVRNSLVAGVLAAVVGFEANYLQWNGHLHALLDGAPLLVAPAMLREAMAFLYENGSWGLRSGGNVTGAMLGLVWLIEAGGILGLTLVVATSAIGSTPYCEKSGSWLDDEKKFDTLAAIDDAQERALLAAGDIAPVIAGRPRAEGATAFTRLTLKHSPRCEDFFTLKAEAVTLSTNKKGEVEEKTQSLTQDLVLPREMRELVEEFANITPTPAADAATAAAPGA